MDFTINMFSQCRAFTRLLQTEKLKALLFPGPVGVGISNDCCVTLVTQYQGYTRETTQTQPLSRIRAKTSS